MIRRALGSVLLAAVLMFSLSALTLADTFPGPTGNETVASAAFTQVSDGVHYDWTLFADRETIAGYSHLDASYFARVDITCHGGNQEGQAGSLSISFGAEASVPFIVTSKLSAAVARASVTGTEDTYNTCTDTDSFVVKSFAVRFALHATGAPTTFTQQQCIDFSESGDAPMLLTETTTDRTAAGMARVNGQRFAVTDGGIGRLQWSSVPDPSCAP